MIFRCHADVNQHLSLNVFSIKIITKNINQLEKDPKQIQDDNSQAINVFQTVLPPLHQLEKNPDLRQDDNDHALMYSISLKK